MTNDETKDDEMTAASNPAAELTEAECDWFREECAVCLGSGCRKCEAVCDEVERILAARLAAGGAATDDGLRARIEAALAFTDRERGVSCSTDLYSDGCFVGDLAKRVRAALDAAPAPTAAKRDDPDNSACSYCGNPLSEDYHSRIERAADTAAEEPRTEAQIAVKVLHAAEDDMDLSEFYQPSISGGISFECAKAESAAIQWLRDRADRLSRADEEAGS